MADSLPPPPSPSPPPPAVGDPFAAFSVAAGASPLFKRQRRPSVRLADLSAATSLEPSLNPQNRRLVSSKTRPLSTIHHPVVTPRRSRSHRPSASLGDADPRSNGHDSTIRGSESPPNSEDGDGWDDRGDGVRSWLDRIGLGRYAPVFEIHEVDDDALPLLTMEDLKEMGISAVGSRRKMHAEIQKLRKSSSSQTSNSK